MRLFLTVALVLCTLSINGVTGFTFTQRLSIAAQLNNAPINPSWLSHSTMPVAVVETVQGMYKEYNVDKVDDSYLDKNVQTYKKAEETEDSKTKYWAILGVLLGGSFIIPMVQYYWYVADDDDPIA